MKALEKDRTRRYETANGFAADILRHLANEPVLAAPPSRAYRMRKFVRKHRGAVIAASLRAAGAAGRHRRDDVGDDPAEHRRARSREHARAVEAEASRNAIGPVASGRGPAPTEIEVSALDNSDIVLAVAAYDNRDVVLAASGWTASPRNNAAGNGAICSGKHAAECSRSTGTPAR